MIGVGWEYSCVNAVINMGALNGYEPFTMNMPSAILQMRLKF